MDETQVIERTSLASRVRAGVALLDREQPGWTAKIAVDRLDIRNGAICVLGQMYGEFAAGSVLLFGKEYADAEEYDHGFSGFLPGWYDHGEYLQGCRGLTRLWAYVVRTRQAVAQ